MNPEDLETLILMRCSRPPLSEMEMAKLRRLEAVFLKLSPAQKRMHSYCLMNKLAKSLKSEWESGSN